MNPCLIFMISKHMDVTRVCYRILNVKIFKLVKKKSKPWSDAFKTQVFHVLGKYWLDIYARNVIYLAVFVLGCSLVSSDDRPTR